MVIDNVWNAMRWSLSFPLILIVGHHFSQHLTYMGCKVIFKIYEYTSQI